MELLYTDARIVVCLKPAGVLSTDEPGGMPELLRRALGEPETGCVRTVHRLDRPVGGVMVFARCCWRLTGRTVRKKRMRSSRNGRTPSRR